MADEEVSILVTLKNIASFISQTKEAGAALKNIGKSAEEGSAQASSSVGKVDSVVSRVRMAATQGVTSLALMGQHAVSSGGSIGKAMSKIQETAKKPLFGGAAGTIGGMLAGYISVKGIKDAIQSTTDLAKSSESLHQVTGMSVKDAASWEAVSAANGVSQRGFSLALKSTATQIAGFKAGTASSVTVMKDLGISMNDVRAHGGNMNDMLGIVIDKFNAMPAGVDKTKIATQLFGRNWQQILPMLSQGSKGLAEERAEAEKMGVTMGGNASAAALKLHAAQVQLNLATQGLKVQFAENLAPALITIVQSLLKLYAAIAPTLMPAIKTFGSVVASVASYLSKGSVVAKAFQVVLVGFIAAWVAGKVAILAARAATVAWNGIVMIAKAAQLAWKVITIAWTAAQRIATAATWLWNAALEANPIAIVILAIIALVAAFVLIITHMKQVTAFISSAWKLISSVFTTAINFVINFVKKNWPLLVGIFGGPLGLILALFLTHKKQVEQVFTDIVNFVKTIPNLILQALSGITNIITKPFTDAFNSIKSTFSSIGSAVTSPLKSLGSIVGLQHGGVVQNPGLHLVGEAGPELVSLPRGSNVKPIPRAGVQAVQQNAGMPPLVVSVQIQRKEIANAVAKFNNDQLARK